MSRFLRPLSFTAGILLALACATPALSDVFYDVSVAGGGPILLPGDEITLGIHAETTQPEAVALGLRAIYDADVLEFVSGVIPDSIFDDPASQLGGLPNVLTEARAETRFAGPSVNLFQGVSLVPAAGTGVGEGEQFSVTFRVLSGFVGQTTIGIGAFLDWADTYAAVVDGEIFAVSFGDDIQTPSFVEVVPTFLTLNVVPEPGTALLLGLGLVALGRVERRRGVGEV